MKTKTILAVIILTMMLIPVVSACAEPEPTPEPRPQYHYKTTWKNPQYRFIWDGVKWVYNTPDIYREGGRIWVVFPKP